MNAALHVAMVRNDISVEQLAKMTRISKRTLYRRLNEPEDMTLRELKRVSQALNLTEDEMKGVIGWEGK